MKSKNIVFFIVLGIILILVPPMCYALRELIEIHKFNLSEFPENYFLSLFNAVTYKAFVTKVDPLNGLGWGAVALYIMSYFFGNLSGINSSKKYSQNDDYGSHGTARFYTDKEKSTIYAKRPLGWFFGSMKPDQVYSIDGVLGAVYHAVKNALRKNEGDLNMQMIVVGSPGCNKTTGFVLPNIFHLPYIYKKANIGEMPDLVITDPKSEIFSLTANYLENQMGYEVRVLDFIHLKYGDLLNPLDFINSEKELMEIADGYIKSVGLSTGSKGTDSFWDEQEGQALGALMGAVKQTRPEGKRVIVEILSLLTDEFASIDGTIDMVKARQFFLDNVTGASLQLWKNFLMFAKSENTAGNILGGLTGKLKLFALEEIQRITSTTTLDLTKFGAKKEKPMALFIFMSDSDRTFAPLINMILSTMFKQLYTTARKYRNKLANPVYFIIDEMANIGKIGGIQEMLGTMRGRRIYPMMIWQSLAQMKDRFGEGWEDVLSMCDTHVYLGVNDDFSAEYCSKTLGKTTIKTQNISRSNKTLGVDQKSESQSYTQRPLLFPDEVKGMDNTKLIMSQRSRHRSLFYKVQYKYWEEKYEICPFKDVEELPLIISHLQDFKRNVSVNTITDTENKKLHEHELVENKEVEVEIEENTNPFKQKDSEKEMPVNPFRDR